MLRLKELRDKLKTTQQQAATYLGVSRPTYTRYENGEREPSIEMIKKLADFFNVSTDLLLGYSADDSDEVATVTVSSGTEVSATDEPSVQTIIALSEDDKANVARYIEFMKKRNSAQ